MHGGNQLVADRDRAAGAHRQPTDHSRPRIPKIGRNGHGLSVDHRREITDLNPVVRIVNRASALLQPQRELVVRERNAAAMNGDIGLPPLPVPRQPRTHIDRAGRCELVPLVSQTRRQQPIEATVQRQLVDARLQFESRRTKIVVARAV